MNVRGTIPQCLRDLVSHVGELLKRVEDDLDPGRRNLLLPPDANPRCLLAEQTRLTRIVGLLRAMEGTLQVALHISECP